VLHKSAFYLLTSKVSRGYGVSPPQPTIRVCIGTGKLCILLTYIEGVNGVWGIPSPADYKGLLECRRLPSGVRGRVRPNGFGAFELE